MKGDAVNRPRGVLIALSAAMLFGVSAPIAKLLLRDQTPQLLAGLLYAGSGLGLFLVWLLQRSRKKSAEAALTWRDARWLAGAIVAGGIMGPVLLMTGLSQTPASAASLLLNLEGVFTALLAWFVFRENFDKRIAVGMAAILAGGLVVSWEGRLAWGSAVGPLLVAAACLSWAIDNNLTQKVSGGDPVQIAMIKGLVAGTVNTVIALSLGAHFSGGRQIAAAMVLGFLSYGVSLVFFVLALRQLGTARTGAYFSTAPFVGAVVSLLVFRERPTIALLIAATLMGIGVWLHLSERHEHEHVHEPTTHEHAHVHDAHHSHVHGPGDPGVADPTPHSHVHRHESLRHSHPHYPDLHHRHEHERPGEERHPPQEIRADAEHG